MSFPRCSLHANDLDPSTRRRKNSFDIFSGSTLIPRSGNKGESYLRLPRSSGKSFAIPSGGNKIRLSFPPLLNLSRMEKWISVSSTRVEIAEKSTANPLVRCSSSSNIINATSSLHRDIYRTRDTERERKEGGKEEREGDGQGRGRKRDRVEHIAWILNAKRLRATNREHSV